jgi:RNA polymerase sigma factor (sigma-70 family)
MVNAQLDTVVRQLRRLATDINDRELTDAQLLRKFADQRDEAAFAALVRRHQRLVWSVCRHALDHVQDAEDAFQATFLVLAQNGAKIRNQDMLGSWLHGVARRIALRAKRAGARRLKHERAAANVPHEKEDSELSWREVRQVLDDEVQRLPQKYRAPFVLCVLEGQSLAEAARQLGWKAGTVSGRLASARKQLQKRLARRGIGLSALLAAISVAHTAPAASPAAVLTASATRTAIAFTTRSEAAAGLLPPRIATLLQGETMRTTKLKWATALLLAVNCGIAGVGMLGRERADARSAETPKAPAAKAAGSQDDARPGDANKESDTLVMSGRVLDPTGKPVAGAKLYLLDFSAAKEEPKVQANSDATGRFHFRIARADVQLPPYSGNRWDHVFLCATAEGHGPALHALRKPESPRELTLHLVKDDVSIRGRVLDLQGKPVAGVAVRVVGLLLPDKGDLAAFAAALKASKDGYPVENKLLIRLQNPAIARMFAAASTDAAGRFQMKGIGRERIAVVEISGPTIETRLARVMTRPGEPIQRLEWNDYPHSGRLTYYGASFNHVAAPTTPIVGVVRDKDTQKPLAGAIVTSWKLAGDDLYGRTFIRTTADKEGRYRLTGMPRGEGNMIEIAGPEGEPYLEVKKDVPAAQGIETATVNAELKRGVWIKGRVTDKATGQPMPAYIEYFAFADNPYRKDAPGFWPRLPTKDNGTFRFVGLPGRGLIGARAFQDRYLIAVGSEKFTIRDDGLRTIATAPPCITINYHTLSEVAPAKDAASATCDITLDPGRTLTGTVIGPDGKPLSGARMGGVTGFSISSWEHKTQPTAEFTVYAVKEGQTRNVLVLHEEKQLAGSLMIRGDEKGPLTIKLKPWGVLTGRFVTGDGQPRPDAEVALERYGERLHDPSCGYHRSRSFQTDKDGKFRIEGLVPGLKYTMHFKNKGRLAGTLFEDLTVESGESRNLGDVQVKE